MVGTLHVCAFENSKERSGMPLGIDVVHLNWEPNSARQQDYLCCCITKNIVQGWSRK